MPVNPTIKFQKAEEKYSQAQTVKEKLIALNEMLKTAPSHKGAEVLRADIKKKISKYKTLLEKEKQTKKGKSKYSIKKEGAATIVIIGTPNSGKTTLLNKLTNKNAEVADYSFTTKEPEIGTMDYKGVKIRIIEIPAITERFYETQNGPAFLSIIRTADLILLLYKNKEERELLLEEIEGIDVKILDYKNQKDLKQSVWDNLDLIKIHTKSPGKEKDSPPIAMEKNSTVKDLAEKVHKDFVKKFKFARIWGTSVKFEGAQVSLSHVLQNEDIVELHLK